MDKPQVYKIVLTGGACGGKTTALTRLTEQLEKQGIRVFRVPEAATLIFTGGVTRDDVEADTLRFQSNLIRLQMRLEETYISQAESCKQPSVVLMDRGVMDNRGFIDADTWQALLDFNDWNEVTLRDQRYDAVIHMITAADGAQEFYSLENNPARIETPEGAREVDHKLQEAWLGHPHLRVIDNSTDFAGKIHRVMETVCQVIGIPTPTEIERKFLVSEIPADEDWTIPFRDVEIEQTYLVSPNPEQAVRVRKRGNNGSYTYTHTIKHPMKDGQRVEIEHTISAWEYLNRMMQKDPLRKTIRKVRRTFLWKNHYFELDLFTNPSDLILLEIELLRVDDQVELPPFISISREVTEELTYQNSQLAKI